MGWSYAISPTTGKEVLCCDFCDNFKGYGAEWVRKINCPAGYCQAWATCDNCFAGGKHKVASCGFGSASDNKDHTGCKRMEKERALTVGQQKLEIEQIGN